jgi:hypothetical protein
MFSQFGRKLCSHVVYVLVKTVQRAFVNVFTDSINTENEPTVQAFLSYTLVNMKIYADNITSSSDLLDDF